MPSRTAPTARQRRLGTELRKMREHAGMSVAEAGRQLGTNGTGVSNIEAGRFGVSEERVRVLASIYRCADQPYVDALAAMAKERGKGWWEDYRGILAADWLDLAELEHHARGLWSLQVVHMPGLLQTEEYAKAVFATAVPEPTPGELRRRLSHRMKRRDVLDRVNPPQCTFLIHESATRVQFGGSGVMRSQLEYVLEASERDNISVRIVPFSAEGFPHTGSSIFYATGPVSQLDTVHLDVANGTVQLGTETHLRNYRSILGRAEEMSLTAEDTRDFIRNLTKQP